MNFLAQVKARYSVQSRVELPSMMTLDLDLNASIEQDGADALSDEVGYCVKGFNFKILSKNAQKQKVLFYEIEWDTEE